MTGDVRIKVERAPNRCPYCHDAVRVSEEAWVACAGCLARHHAECWSDRAPGRCAACGGEAALEPPPPRARPVAARADAEATEVPAARPGEGAWAFGKLLVALGIGAAAYHALMKAGIGQTSALFVGLPALLAVVLLLTPAPKTTRGGALKLISMLLAISGLIFNEGIICILMAAPLFLAFGLLVGWLFDPGRSKGPLRAVALPLVLLTGLEGTTPELSLPRDEVVAADLVVDGAPADVARRLAARPRFAASLPLALQLGFPRPTRSRGEGLAPGDRRVIHLVGGEGSPGDLVLRVAASGPGFARFVVEADRSHTPHYLDWRWSEVRWEAAGAGRTRVRWTLGYTRRVDPAWYFAPCERWCAELAVVYLARALAGPAQDATHGGVPEGGP